MTEFLLKRKWIGLVSVILVSVLCASYWSGLVSTAYKESEPIILNEVGYFIPVTVEKGQIVFPKNTVIERTYGTATNPYKVVLNTEVDDLDISNLTPGIYFTRDKIYSYDSAKGETKIQSMEKIPDMKITRQDVNEGFETIGKYLHPVLFSVIFVFLMIYIGFIALLGTLVMQWWFKKAYNANFSFTLRVNILASVALFLVCVLLDVYLGLFVTLLIMIACNYLANICLENKSPKMS